MVVIIRMVDYLRNHKPLFMGLSFGLFGLLPDLDHFATLWNPAYIKPFHWFILLYSSYILCLAGACVGGLLVVSVLKKKGNLK